MHFYGGVADVRTVASLEQMMPKNVEEIKTFNMLRDNYLGQDMIAIVLELDRNAIIVDRPEDIRDQEIIVYTQHIKQTLEQELDIRQVYTPSDVIMYAAMQQGLLVQSVKRPDKGAIPLSYPK